ncbi:hypothetical protein ES703_59012 [subsurface metagenome]
MVGKKSSSVFAKISPASLIFFLSRIIIFPINYWQIGAKDFVPVERVAQLREREKDFREVDMMAWVSRHLPELEKQYEGKWIAVFDCEVIAASTSISEVLEEVRALGIENPFVTQIPAQPTVWTTAYAQQGI